MYFAGCKGVVHQGECFEEGAFTGAGYAQQKDQLSLRYIQMRDMKDSPAFIISTGEFAYLIDSFHSVLMSGKMSR